MQMISMSGSRENEVQSSAVPGSPSVSTTTYHPSLIIIFQKLRWIYFSSPIDGVAVLTDTIGAMAATIIERETAGTHISISTITEEMKHKVGSLSVSV